MPTHSPSNEAPDLTVAPSLENQKSDPPPPALVTKALEHILESAAFRTSERGKQFLSFIVNYQLENHPETLKERTIGVALFNRPLDYATGDDSVVRAQAREVRRRLEKYYTAYSVDDLVKIDLPVGSYSPDFRWATSKVEIPEPPPGSQALSVLPVVERLGVSHSGTALPGTPSNRRKLLFGVVVAVLCILVVAVVVAVMRKATPESTLSQFWSPVFTSSKPLLICLPKPIMYRPSAGLYKRSAQAPGEFDREVDRMTRRPHLRGDETIQWGDMVEYYDFGVGEGDVKAAFKLSQYFTRQGKDSEVRIGEGYTTADLRDSPAVVIGAFDNPRAIEMTSGLHFSFVDDDKGIRIQESGPSGRSWFTIHGPTGKDFGLVTRLVNSSTGQFVVIVAGVEASGSDAAADLSVESNALEAALRDTGQDWPKKNLQILVSTDVKDGVAGPAQVVAVYAW